jgi:flagellar biogenesis protein FliO
MAAQAMTACESVWVTNVGKSNLVVDVRGSHIYLEDIGADNRIHSRFKG